jgi:hypothetical protein
MAHPQFRWKIGVKRLLNIDFWIWVGQVSIFLKQEIGLIMIDYLQFYVPLKNFSLIWRRHHYRLRAAKFRPMLGTQGLWAGRGLYRATPAVTRGLGFSCLIRRLWSINRGCLLPHGTWSHLWYIQRSVYDHSLIYFSYRTYEIEYCSLFLSFHSDL